MDETLSATLIGEQSGAEVFNRSCCTVASKEEFEFTMEPSAASINSGIYAYATDQNVTLTCKVKDAGEMSRSRPYVFIESCSGGVGTACNEWIQSVPGMGTSHLILSGISDHESRAQNWNFLNNNSHGCQFACWSCSCDGADNPGGDAADVSMSCLLAFTGLFRTVRFGEKPSLKTFQCESRNWRILKCMWIFHRGNSDDSTRYAVSYEYKGSHYNVTGSPAQEENQISISLEIADNFTPDVTYTFDVVINTSFGRVIATNNVTTSSEIVKLDLPETLTVTSDDVNPTLLHVTWILPDDVNGILGQLDDVLDCRLRVVSMETWLPGHNLTINVSKPDCQHRRAVITGLHPFAHYSVYLQYKNLASVFWSDEVEAPGLTSQGVPSAGPELTEGAYTVWTCGSQQCITLYFKDIPTVFRNGVLTSYSASLLPVLSVFGQPTDVMNSHQMTSPPMPSQVRNGPTTSLRQATVFQNENDQNSNVTSSPTNSVTLHDVIVTEDARACVSGATVIGISAVRSCVELPSDEDEKEVPAEPQGVTSEHVTANTSYVIRWRTAEHSENTMEAERRVVFWCVGRVLNMSTVQCVSDLSWDHVDATSSEYVVNASNMADPSTDNSGLAWYFGVNSLAGELSKGITWNKCSYLHKEQGQTVYTPLEDTSRRVVASATSKDAYFTCFCTTSGSTGNDVCSAQSDLKSTSDFPSPAVVGAAVGVSTCGLIVLVLVIRTARKWYHKKSAKFSPNLNLELSSTFTIEDDPPPENPETPTNSGSGTSHVQTPSGDARNGGSGTRSGSRTFTEQISSDKVSDYVQQTTASPTLNSVTSRLQQTASNEAGTRSGFTTSREQNSCNKTEEQISINKTRDSMVNASPSSNYVTIPVSAEQTALDYIGNSTAGAEFWTTNTDVHISIDNIGDIQVQGQIFSGNVSEYAQGEGQISSGNVSEYVKVGDQISSGNASEYVKVGDTISNGNTSEHAQVEGQISSGNVSEYVQVGGKISHGNIRDEQFEKHIPRGNTSEHAQAEGQISSGNVSEYVKVGDQIANGNVSEYVKVGDPIPNGNISDYVQAATLSNSPESDVAETDHEHTLTMLDNTRFDARPRVLMFEHNTGGGFAAENPATESLEDSGNLTNIKFVFTPKTLENGGNSEISMTTVNLTPFPASTNSGIPMDGEDMTPF